ncbi:transposase [Metarhizium guizhouense ARSEF 977]|uniref:Transposase n=1 Tax=Metarhizium guizhouense (strain ARSEF 977) TaxID=1276136 RepID=A0A0B4HQF9_METGA|nr:transposase [Metarhizium guizhouense ARSEF 977]
MPPLFWFRLLPALSKRVLTTKTGTQQSGHFPTHHQFYRVFLSHHDGYRDPAIEKRVNNAIQYLKTNPTAKKGAVAKKFDISRQRLDRRISGILPKFGRHARNAKLSEPEEVALCRYIGRLDKMNLSIRKELIRDAANLILREQSSLAPHRDPPTVGQHWVDRFIKRHKYSVLPQRIREVNRHNAETIRNVTTYFERLYDCITDYGIVGSDIWNMDETGFQIGVGKSRMVVTRRPRASYLGMPTNRESATAIEAISAGGSHTPAFLILTGAVHQSAFYRIPELHDDAAIAVSTSGFTNDELSLEWLKHFDKHTAQKTTGQYRLLIIDGHGSHHTVEFLQYAEDHSIILFGLPPHLTHILQPLDVVVFQPLKHYHAEALDILVRDGCLHITKSEFLATIESVRGQAFKAPTIQSAFRKTGIVPWNPQPILDQIQALHPTSPREVTNPPPNNLSSSPYDTPYTLRHLNKVASKIEDLQVALEELQPALKTEMDRFIRGALVQSTELRQTMKDLARTKMAEDLRKQRKVGKNRPLQVITVSDGRRMVRQSDKNALQAARQMVERAAMRHRNALKRQFEATAKIARKKRLDGVLEPLYVIDAEGCGRHLRRG